MIMLGEDALALSVDIGFGWMQVVVVLHSYDLLLVMVLLSCFYRHVVQWEC
jgi:hypothetical protein